jgi:adenylate kinase family enzyme
MNPSLDRVVVVGSSCSGKTTFAKRLAATLGHPHIELDALNWLPDWVQRPEEEFGALVANAVSSDRWIVDGNYGRVRKVVWPRATSVVWLNYGFPTVIIRALRRTTRRAFSGEELYSGNKESLRKAFLERDSILFWVLTTFRRRRRGYEQLRATNVFPHLQWVEFRRPAEAERFLCPAFRVIS